MIQRTGAVVHFGSSTIGNQSATSPARDPEDCSAPRAAASATVSRPVARRSQVRGSVSTTFGGFPRVVSDPGDALHRDERRHPYLDACAGGQRRQRPCRESHRLGEIGALGRRGGVVAQPVREGGHGSAGLRRIRGTSGGHTLFCLLNVPAFGLRPPSAAVQAGRNCPVDGHRSRRRPPRQGVPRRLRRTDRARRGFGPGRSRRRPRVEGHPQRCRDRPGFAARRQRRRRRPAGADHHRGRRPLSAVDPVERRRRRPGQHRVRQQVRGVQLTETRRLHNMFRAGP